jgi:hypothetical protein
MQPSIIPEWHETHRVEDDGDSDDPHNDIRTRRLGGRSPEVSQTRGAAQMQPC